VKEVSFYESTRRKQVSQSDVLATIKGYDFNYSSYLPSSKEARIVDLGGSEGISLEWLISSGYRNIVSGDLDQVATSHARTRLVDELGKKVWYAWRVDLFKKLS